jgi:hypothetical protein
VAFSQSGTRVAVLEREHLTMYEIDASPVKEHIWPLREARELAFAGDSNILVRDELGLSVLSTDSGALTRLQIQPSAIDGSSQYLVVGDTSGLLVLYNTVNAREFSRIRACRDRVTDIKLLPSKSLIAFACQDSLLEL